MIWKMLSADAEQQVITSDWFALFAFEFRNIFGKLIRSMQCEIRQVNFYWIK